jgi:HD-GYP domain-containing protein (c-di-GMP phosphodiesterase class II)
MKLEQDLYDIYGHTIAPLGSEITPQLIRGLIQQGSHLPKKFISVVKTPLLGDFKKALRDRRYHRLFLRPEIHKEILGTFSKLAFTEPILLELRQMKRELPETYHHVLTMAALVIKMIKDVKMSRYDPVLAAHLCLTHDIGKTRVPVNILNKKSELTAEQYRMIQTHPLLGFLLLAYYCGWRGREYYQTAHDHHEKLDGSGYPRGVRRIDRYSRLIAPVDIYDALISKRPYRKLSYNGRLAIDILLEDAAKGELEKESVYLLINCMREKKVRKLAEIRVSRKRRTEAPVGNHYGQIKKAKARRLLKSD